MIHMTEAPNSTARQDRQYGGRLESWAIRFPVRNRVVWGALGVLVILCATTAPASLNSISLQVVTALAGVLAIASLGQQVVMMQGGIDLSIPALITLSAAFVVRMSDGANGSLLTALIGALVLTTLVGTLNGLLVTIMRLNALVVTLASGGVIAGATQLWTKNQFSKSGLVPPALEQFANKNFGVVNMVGVIALLCVIGFALFMRKTAVGRRFVATGTSPRAARILGVRVRAHQVMAYTVSGFLAGIAGVLLAGFVKSPNFSVGEPYLLLTIVAVVIGGARFTGGPASATGTAAGAVFLVLLDQYLAVRAVSGGVSMLLQSVALVTSVAMVTGISRRKARRGGATRSTA